MSKRWMIDISVTAHINKIKLVYASLSHIFFADW